MASRKLLPFLRHLSIVTLFACLTIGSAEAATVTLVWDASSGSNIAGYKVSFGTGSRQYTSSHDVGNQTSFQFTEPDATKVYYFAVQAYDAAGHLSSFSNEVSTTPTTSVPQSGSCLTPDPFVAIGGGACFNGGWLPPGMPIPAGTQGVVPSISPPASTEPGGCTTPDPFVSIPGMAGICVNGGWSPTLLVAQTGTIRFVPIAGSLWTIEADDGTSYELLADLPAALQVDGLVVAFEGKLRPDIVSTYGIGSVLELSAIGVR